MLAQACEQPSTNTRQYYAQHLRVRAAQTLSSACLLNARVRQFMMMLYVCLKAVQHSKLL